MTTRNVPEPVLERLRSGHRFVLTSHLSPDGDAVGSELGLARVLQKFGKGAVIWNRDPAPRIYHPLRGSHRIHVGPEPPKGFPEDFDAAVVLECPSLDRCGLEDQLADMALVNIDHHLGNQHYGVVNWVDTAAPAVGEMVFRLARALHVDLDRDTANALYLTLVTDTGGFRYSNTTAETFDAAASLVRSGAVPETVSQWLYESQPVSALRLVSEMLRTLELHSEGRIATAWLTDEMVQRSGATAGDTEGLIDYPRSIAGVDTAALFRQLADGRFKVSLRSRGTLSVERIAQRFGGGGHRNAAGFPSELPKDELFGQTLAALAEAVGPSPNQEALE